MTVQEALAGAYHLLDDKRRWTQGAAARNKEGQSLFHGSQINGSDAVQWCALGALWRVSGNESSGYSSNGVFVQAQIELAQELGCTSRSFAHANTRVANVNDGEDGYRKVRAAMRRAIRRLSTVEEPAVAPVEDRELTAV